MSKHDRAIIIDFDHTIFNTTAYVAKLRGAFKASFGISEEDFMKYRDEVKRCCAVVDMDTFIEHLPVEDKAAMHALHHEVIRDHAAEFIFDDVQDFIMRHSDSFDILITTHGDTELQTEKIMHSQLPDVVEWVISKDSKDVVVGKFADQYKEIHFIDDKAENIDAVKQAHQDVITYFIARPDDHPYADKKTECECVDKEIQNLHIDLH